MKRLWIFLVLLFLVISVFSDDLRFIRDGVPNKHIVGPGGVYMMLSHYNRNIARDQIQGYECELQVFTPEFNEQITIFPDAFVTVFVVRNDHVVEIQDNLFQSPTLPKEGYLVVGHGRASVAFMKEFSIGDKIAIRDYSPAFQDEGYKGYLVLADGSEVKIAGWNRARCADEIVAFSSD